MGLKTKKPFYKRGWFIVVVVFVLLYAIGTSGSDDTETDDGASQTASIDKPKEEVKKEKYEIVGEVTSETDSMATYIKGVIKNNSGHDISYAQVTFTLYDKDGNQLGTAMDNINDLKKDGTWKFKAMGMNTDGEIASYELSEITGF
ncbi:FxLYD domain-containing protein [Clostridioides difficile]|uniref:FxLYD domain-containing protein n=1 Tax=Clostridioides difficile TaxID=1496 RepID=UPI002ED69FF6